MINFANPKKENSYFKKKNTKNISKVINSNQYILGKEVAKSLKKLFIVYKFTLCMWCIKWNRCFNFNFKIS